VAARLVVHMLNLGRPKFLALDRTNWKLGSRDINMAIVTRRFRVPLLFTLLPHQRSCDTASRIALMRRYLALFPAASIRCLLAYREFIGAQWMDFLNENNIPFAIRVKKIDMTLTLEDGRTWSLATLLRKQARYTTALLRGRINGTDGAARSRLPGRQRLADGEWVIVATNRPDPKQALNDYRKRWGIECLFGDTKTRGFNIEDTHITNPDKLATLIVVIMLATAWAYRCATQSMGMKAIPRKSPGRRQKSWFRIGLDALRDWIINKPKAAADSWAAKVRRTPLLPIKNH
jgi:Transposase DDE domain